MSGDVVLLKSVFATAVCVSDLKQWHYSVCEAEKFPEQGMSQAQHSSGHKSLRCLTPASPPELSRACKCSAPKKKNIAGPT